MPISVYRLNTKIRSTMLCLSFELYSRLIIQTFLRIETWY